MKCLAFGALFQLRGFGGHWGHIGSLIAHIAETFSHRPALPPSLRAAQ